MECNRDEAKRAKEIAERKFSAKDIIGAKKFAVKAQSLYPGLDGISQLLATLDVYVAAENKISGESDWYGILGVNPQADDDTVRKNYRKLALSLHPDKNKSRGADGAFKHISEAWSLLSDKARRSAYDQKRNVKVFKQKVQTQNGGSSTTPPGSNGFYNFTNSTSTTTGTKTPKPPNTNTPKASASSIPPPSNKTPRTFWTVCHRCKMQYEYLRMYLYQNLLCPNCHEPFLAVETPPPNTNVSKVANHSNNKGASKNVPNPGKDKSSSQKTGPGDFSARDSSNYNSFQWAPFSKTNSVASTAHAASMVRRAYERVKREREEAQAATKREERRKKHSSKKTGGVSSSGQSNAMKKKQGSVEDFFAKKETLNQKGTGSSASLSGLKQGSDGQVKVSGTNKPNGMRSVSNTEIQNHLMEKARMEIRKKLHELSSATVLQSAVGGEKNLIEKVKEKGKEKEMVSVLVNGVKVDQRKSTEPVYARNGVTSKKPIEPLLIDVPDPDFHDFDRDRTERCFGENQVWAAYDDDDGMPRYYGIVHNVISVDPFKIKISWLSSKTNNEKWIGSGFSKTCGEFRIGKLETNLSLNSFSHKVSWTKGERGAVLIYPRKGDVWALYRNWSPEWNELTPDEVIHKYDIVEVEDNEEEQGVTVTPLVKVAGFKTVFHRHLDPKEVRIIPRDEIFRFSHQMPSYLLTGQEAPNAPKGCRELDPAATPLEFLNVIDDAKEAENVEHENMIDVENLDDCVQNTNNEEREENSSKAAEETYEDSNK